MRHYLDNRSMDDVAIERIRSFEPQALEMHPNGYWLAYSGGKDSDVALSLMRRSGCKFEAHHSLTTLDPVEVVRHVQTHKDVHIDKPDGSFWDWLMRGRNGVPAKKILPLRKIRWCCKKLKERGGVGRLIVTGVRWAESPRRATRKMVEGCYRNKATKYLHPIIDWETEDVWSYIQEQRIPYCRLYDEGWDRVGCILCPMISNPDKIARDVQRFPVMTRRLKQAAYWVWENNPAAREKWPNAEAYWDCWLNNRRGWAVDDEQPVLFEDDPTQV